MSKAHSPAAKRRLQHHTGCVLLPALVQEAVAGVVQVLERHRTLLVDSHRVQRRFDLSLRRRGESVRSIPGPAAAIFRPGEERGEGGGR